MSLLWLPFSVSAEISLASTNKDNCHEINSTMSGKGMSVRSVHNLSVRNFSGQSAMTNQIAAIDHSMHESMKKKCCCEDECVACIGAVSCGHNSNHASAFILFNPLSSQPLPIIQLSIEQFVQYYNQIITPDIRPPIV